MRNGATGTTHGGGRPARLFLAVLALALSAAVPAGAGGAEEERLQVFIDSEMPASGVPGMAYAVVEGNEITMAGARGVVDVRGNTEVTPDTPFGSGSISKSFTALAIMQLVEAGDVDLDTEVAQYLDGFAGRPAGAPTLRQLLSHTSGFSTLQGNASHTDATGDGDELARMVAGLADVDPAYVPGERWEYSNTNYQILGRVIEVVSGQDYQTYVTANILEPVGMDDSFVSDGEVHEGMATGHRPWFLSKRPVSDTATHRATAPQGGIVASANDLARFMGMMMNGEDDVLSARGKAQMMRPGGAAAAYYGFGWALDPANETVWHSGSSPGVETLATMVPDEKRGVVVLVNGGSGIGFGETGNLRTGVTALALDLAYEDEGPRWAQKAIFLSLVLLPIVYLVSMAWAWRHRDGLRSKSGPFGLFSLWFPLLTTLAAAWTMLWLVPNLFGVPLGTLFLFQPDFGLALLATSVFGVLWAVFRLGVAYTRSSPAGGSA